MVADGPEYQPSRRCHHCGRSVCETFHTPTGYRVDYYSLHTGAVEPASRTTDAGAQVNFFKLLAPIEIVTCATCYRLASVQRERDERFRPERSLLSEVDSRE
jgi:hypothetical protein